MVALPASDEISELRRRFYNASVVAMRHVHDELMVLRVRPDGGIPHTEEDGSHVYPQPAGVIESLERRGFRTDERGRPGNIHFEKYW